MAKKGRDPIKEWVTKKLKAQGENETTIAYALDEIENYEGADRYEQAMNWARDYSSGENTGPGGGNSYFNDKDLKELSQVSKVGKRTDSYTKAFEGLAQQERDRNAVANFQAQNPGNFGDTGIREDKYGNPLMPGQYVLNDGGSAKTNYYGGGAIPNFLPDIMNFQMQEQPTGKKVMTGRPGSPFSGKTYNKKSGRGGGSAQRKTATPNETMDANGNKTTEYMRLANDLKTNELMRGYQNLMNIEPEGIDETLPDRGRDWAGYVGDAGRMIMGWEGMNEDIPRYKPSAEMVESIADARRQKEIGLSAEEEEYMEQGADRAYHSDVANIRRMSGGSAGTALANLGSASSRYYDNMAGIAAQDQAVRRQAEGRFDERAGQAENIKRIQHAEDRDLAMRTVEGAAGLFNDAVTNMQERKQYEDTYVMPDSAHAMLEDELILDTRQSRADRTNASKVFLESERRKYLDDIIAHDINVNGAKVYSTDAKNNEYINSRQNQGQGGGNARGNADVAFADAMSKPYSGGEDLTVKTRPTKNDDGKVFAGDVKYSSNELELKDELAKLKPEERGELVSRKNPMNDKKEALSKKLKGLKTGSKEYQAVLDEMDLLDEEMIKWEQKVLDDIK